MVRGRGRGGRLGVEPGVLKAVSASLGETLSRPASAFLKRESHVAHGRLHFFRRRISECVTIIAYMLCGSGRPSSAVPPRMQRFETRRSDAAGGREPVRLNSARSTGGESATVASCH